MSLLTSHQKIEKLREALESIPVALDSPFYEYRKKVLEETKFVSQDTEQDREHDKLGKELIELLHLKEIKRDSTIVTAWGHKTAAGLTRMVMNIINKEMRIY